MGGLRRFYERFGMFIVPVFILIALVFGVVLQLVYKNLFAANIAYVIAIIPGAIQLLIESFLELKRKSFALDYIAILAIAVSIISEQYLVGGVIALMISSGGGLEKYAQKRAKSSLTALANRIPDEVMLYKSNTEMRKEKIESIKIGDRIFVRKGEVIPLDGLLLSEYGQTDESSLTGEPYFVDKMRGDKIRSGTVNMGGAIIVKVEKEDKDSTYRQIINMVKEAQEEKSPMIRIAHKYNAWFAILALAIAFGAWLYWHDLNHVLAVLVIATPCPLLIAAPVALIGGMSASAKKKIIVKNLAAIEAVSRANTLVFDKTGTITLGKPILKHIIVKARGYNERKVLSIAEAIERNSVHPFAHSIIALARKMKVPALAAKDVNENLGKGISGTIGNKKYTIVRGNESNISHLHLMEGRKIVAEIVFEDVMKSDAKKIIWKLKSMGMDMHIFTGDKKESAEIIKHLLDHGVDVHAEMSPSDKQKGIKILKSKGRTIAMVGDGINDAPALALADVGMVFSHEEHTASSEAADIVFLGGGFKEVYNTVNISRRTMKIAKQSMITGISLSIAGMIFAAFGFIIPLVGAVLQEAIDVSVIINSLRAIRFKSSLKKNL